MDKLRCVVICPLPSNADGSVQVEPLGVRGADLLSEGVECHRRFRVFGSSNSSHETSVVIPSWHKGGVLVDPNQPACEGMIDLYNYRGGGAIGGALRCPILPACDYGSGSGRRK